MTYPDLNSEPELLKRKTRDDEIKKIKYQTEKTVTKIIYNHLKLIIDFIKNYSVN